ncbi:hypothetical protein KKB43_03835 [Patescibacteria group bacterium]|nr:hypothetical protein [Patescibacteria group bacterium]
MKKIIKIILLIIILISLSITVSLITNNKYNLFTKRPTFICGTDTTKDVDGNIYKTVKIGSQCWLKENLKVARNPEGNPIIRYCYSNDPKICETDGGLYDWNTIMVNSIEEGAQGICPNGWHIPKDSEWYILENYLKDNNQVCSNTRNGISVWYEKNNEDCSAAGTKLKTGGSSGFESVFPGYINTSDKSFYNRSINVYFWSSTLENKINSENNPWVRNLDSTSNAIYRFTSHKFLGSSVRCLKD